MQYKCSLETVAIYEVVVILAKRFVYYLAYIMVGETLIMVVFVL